jgi:hypothetical protein
MSDATANDMRSLAANFRPLPVQPGLFFINDYTIYYVSPTIGHNTQ